MIFLVLTEADTAQNFLRFFDIALVKISLEVIYEFLITSSTKQWREWKTNHRKPRIKTDLHR
jgi:hypothetical protein